VTHLLRLLWAVAAAALALAPSGCTFFACSGGGPLRQRELGDWAGLAPRAAPAAARLEALTAELKATANRPFAGRYSLRGDASYCSMTLGQILDVPFGAAPGLRIKGRLNPWLRFVPGPQHGDWLYYDESGEATRRFYAWEDEWDALVAWGERAEACEIASRQRVAARRIDEVIGLGLGWTRVRLVRPVDSAGDAGFHAVAFTKRPLADARYDLRYGNILLLGLLCWGRVNRTRYIQLLWIPIPVGNALP